MGARRRGRVRGRARARAKTRARPRPGARAQTRLTIHHKFWGNLAELRQEACRDGGLVAYVTRHGAWARMALLAHGATRAGTTATHGHEHDGCRRSSRAGLLMNGRLPAANEGARWCFERARCGWPRSRGRTAGQPVALRRPWARTAYRGGALHCDWAGVRSRELVAASWVGCRVTAVARVGCRITGWLPYRAPVIVRSWLRISTAA